MVKNDNIKIFIFKKYLKFPVPKSDEFMKIYHFFSILLIYYPVFMITNLGLTNENDKIENGFFPFF